MIGGVDHLLPSAEALGDATFWLFGLAALLQSFVVTGILVPGAVMVVLGGAMVGLGLMDGVDLLWFTATGAFLGAALSYHAGRWIRRGTPGRDAMDALPAFAEARRRVAAGGGAALILGRVMGPLAGLMPLAAGMNRIGQGRFAIWNAAGSLFFALLCLGIGLILGHLVGWLPGQVSPLTLFTGGAVCILLLVWAVLLGVALIATIAGYLAGV